MHSKGEVFIQEHTRCQVYLDLVNESFLYVHHAILHEATGGGLPSPHVYQNWSIDGERRESFGNS